MLSVLHFAQSFLNARQLHFECYLSHFWHFKMSPLSCFGFSLDGFGLFCCTLCTFGSAEVTVSSYRFQASAALRKSLLLPFSMLNHFPVIIFLIAIFHGSPGQNYL